VRSRNGFNRFRGGLSDHQRIEGNVRTFEGGISVNKAVAIRSKPSIELAVL
jgi:hypothetical protein